MEKIPQFFVPAATSENQESVYNSFANMCHVPIPEKSKRIYSITYIHDGEEWVATVGEQLHGVRIRITRSRGNRIERKTELNDPATVLAIFPGSPYFVVTNQRIVGDIGSAWENPFMVGNPKLITIFSTT